MDKEIEIRRLESEERRFEQELELKKKELEFQLQQFEANRKKKGFFAQIFSPVGVAVIAAIVGLLGTAASGLFNSYIENTKQQASLILKTSEISDEKQRAKNLLFYAELGYLNFSSQYKKSLRKMAGLENDQQVPPPSTTVNFIPSAALTPELQRTLEKAIEDFQAYAQKTGFAIATEKVDVKITSEQDAAAGGENKDYIASYDPPSKSIVVNRDYADDANTVLRQYAHHLLMSSNETIPNDYYAIESGLASYFPCSFSNHPMVGDKSGAAQKGLFQPEKLINNRKFSEINLADWDSVQLDGSEIWGGAFWDLRQRLGRETADKLLYSTWTRLERSTHQINPYIYFVNALMDADKTIEDGKNAARIKEVFERRGLTF